MSGTSSLHNVTISSDQGTM